MTQEPRSSRTHCFDSFYCSVAVFVNAIAEQIQNATFPEAIAKALLMAVQHFEELLDSGIIFIGAVVAEVFNDGAMLYTRVLAQVFSASGDLCAG